MPHKRFIYLQWISYEHVRRRKWLKDIWYIGAIIAIDKHFENDGSYSNNIDIADIDETGLPYDD